LERVWQANGLDEEAQLAHLDALVFGRSYATVGTNEEDSQTPLIAVESPLEMLAERDPRTRAGVGSSAADGRAVDGGHGYCHRRTPVYATLYLPDQTIWLTGSSSGNRWVEEDRDEHRLGAGAGGAVGEPWPVDAA
jgi:hypothetical protein